MSRGTERWTQALGPEGSKCHQEIGCLRLLSQGQGAMLQPMLVLQGQASGRGKKID